jgi:spermidine synthase
MEEVLKKSTEKQKIFLYKEDGNNSLYLGNPQQLKLNSKDYYRYYEAITHPALSSHPNSKSVLVLGGGDGCIAAELLKYPELEDIDNVDWDEELTKLCTDNGDLAKINNYSLQSNRVTKIKENYREYLSNTDKKYDIILLDYHLPEEEEWNKLFTVEFFTLLRPRLVDDKSMFVMSSGSPTESPKSFWCILQTMLEAGFYVTPYHQFIPSQGDWGFNVGSIKPFKIVEKFAIPTKSLNKNVIHAMMVFGPDQLSAEVEVNTDENAKLVDYTLGIEDEV